MRVLITGVAGFIGSNLAEQILAQISDAEVTGVDNMNDYYDVSLKEARLLELKRHAKFTFIRGDIADRQVMEEILRTYQPEIVFNLAAQVGVRSSMVSPDSYIESNIIGFYNVLEACRHSYEMYEGGVRHLIYASSSSVYGANSKVPYSVDDKADSPVSLYASTKKSNEVMAHAYSKLYDIPVTGLRFFTVYGPAGRPDMAYFDFADKMVRGETIRLFNYGNCRRDFTYIDDVVKGLILVMRSAPVRCTGEDGLPIPPYALYNIGNGAPESILDFVKILHGELVDAGVLTGDYDLDAHLELAPMQPGDVPVTFADTSALERDLGFRPSTPLHDGLKEFALWYARYYANI